MSPPTSNTTRGGIVGVGGGGGTFLPRDSPCVRFDRWPNALRRTKGCTTVGGEIKLWQDTPGMATRAEFATTTQCAAFRQGASSYRKRSPTLASNAAGWLHNAWLTLMTKVTNAGHSMGTSGQTCAGSRLGSARFQSHRSMEGPAWRRLQYAESTGKTEAAYVKITYVLRQLGLIKRGRGTNTFRQKDGNHPTV